VGTGGYVHVDTGRIAEIGRAASCRHHAREDGERRIRAAPGAAWACDWATQQNAHRTALQKNVVKAMGGVPVVRRDDVHVTVVRTGAEISG